MARKSLNVKVGGKTVHLRLTVHGQRNLKERFGVDAFELIMDASADMEKLIGLLDEALSWTDSGNEITSGEELYDLLVDESYAGQGKFAELAVNIGVVSGLIDMKNGEKVKATMSRYVDSVFDRMDEAANTELLENPTRLTAAESAPEA